MPVLKIIPILGLKTNVAADDPSLFKWIGEGVALTHDTGGQNIDYQRTDNACSKAYGYEPWSNTAVGTPNRCHGLFELDDGTNRDNIIFESGRFFVYDASKDPGQKQNAYIEISSLAADVAAGDSVTGDTTSTSATVVSGLSAGSGNLYIKDVTGGTGDFSATESLTFDTPTTADCDSVILHTTFSNSDGDLYSMIRFGSYIIFSDLEDGHTPQKWKNGETNLENLITTTGATLYKFRYLIEWQRRIIGAYSDQTNGDLEIRWTGALPTWTDLDFAAANQLYKPGVDSISGISKIGANSVLLYGTESINRLDYYPDASAPFGFTTLVQGQGCTSHHSIINHQGANWFFNKNYGFVRYVGGSKIMTADIISKEIESLISDIDSRYYDRIYGVPIPLTNELVWAVPQGSEDTPSHLFYYHIPSKTWRREVKAMQALSNWTQATGEAQKLVSSNTDGHTNKHTNASLGASEGSFDGYRIEPIMDFGTREHLKYINKIWFDTVVHTAETIDVYHRSGDSVDELIEQSWTSIGTLPCQLYYGETPTLYPSLMARLHQFKWGSDNSGEEYTVNGINIAYQIRGKY